MMAGAEAQEKAGERGARGAVPAWRVVPVSHRFISFPRVFDTP